MKKLESKEESVSFCFSNLNILSHQNNSSPLLSSLPRNYDNFPLKNEWILDLRKKYCDFFNWCEDKATCGLHGKKQIILGGERKLCLCWFGNPNGTRCIHFERGKRKGGF